MSWRYEQDTGKLFSPSGLWLGTGYSGFGAAKNNPLCQAVRDNGPIPQGWWMIGVAFDHLHLGPRVMALLPRPDTDTFGRSQFFIHGDSRQHPGEASHGCIILGPKLRGIISSSKDDLLHVVCTF
jgi:hypothetical protein